MNQYFDKDYFESGLETGKSCYQNYRWMPEQTISFAMSLVDHFNLTPDSRILDFGCSKGFLVKAFHILHRVAFGYDCSKYAISQVPVEVKEYCSRFLPDEKFDLCIAKDVFEHIPLKDLAIDLERINSKLIFAIIPLGDGEVYRSKVNNLDPSHIVCYSETEWMDFFEANNWDVLNFSFWFSDIKDHHPKRSHGFFTLGEQNDRDT